MKRFAQFILVALLVAPTGCASSMGNLQRESARVITPNPLPSSVSISNVRRSASSVEWVATLTDGTVYDCSSDDMLRRALCVKRTSSEEEESSNRTGPVVITMAAPESIQSGPQSGTFGAGISIGHKGGYIPSAQFGVSDRLILEGSVALYSMVTALGMEAYYRFPKAQSEASFLIEPVIGGGLYKVSIDTGFGSEGLTGLSASGGVFAHLAGNKNWRFKGVLSLVQFDYEGASLRGTNAVLGAYYFF